MSFFTAPEFLSMPAVGLDVSADTVRFIELEAFHKKLKVSRYATRNFSDGLPVKGQTHDKQKLKEMLAQLAREYKLSFVNISLPEERAYLANIQIPRVAPSEIRETIEFRLEEYVPISAAAAIFDYIVVDDGANKRKDTIDVVVSALPRIVVEEYLEVFSGTGIIPKTFEFESQSMARALIPKGDNGTFLVVDIGKIITDIFVCAKSVVQFSASLDIGGHYFTQAIERALNVTYAEAEELKSKHGLIGGAKEQELHEAIMPVIADLRTRIMRHYSYWQTHHREKFGGNIECIYLTGGSANLKGLVEYLSADFDVKVDIANPWVNVCSFEEYIPPLTLSESHGYATAIGLALRDTITQ